jgi:hypothetical protein
LHPLDLGRVAARLVEEAYRNIDARYSDATPRQFDGMATVTASISSALIPDRNSRWSARKLASRGLLRHHGTAPQIERKAFKKRLKPIWIHFYSP